VAISVFIADDHAILSEGLAALMGLHYDITVVGMATNGREAIEQVLKLKPDVVLLDISMPILNGIEATRQIIEKMPKMAIIMLSVHSDTNYVFHALEAGARGYLLKESAAKELIDAVRKVHSGRRYLSPKVAEIVAEGLSDRSGANLLDSLSKREREILKLVADGFSSSEIGGLLFLSPKTVDSYRSRMMQKLGVSDLAGLIKFAILHGVTSLQ
jgi:DNA-binding NarL/FixJ family response regulator